MTVIGSESSQSGCKLRILSYLQIFIFDLRDKNVSIEILKLKFAGCLVSGLQI